MVGPLVLAGDVRAVWDSLSVDQQRAIVDALMTITLHPVGRGARTFDPASVQVEWKDDTP